MYFSTLPVLEHLKGYFKPFKQLNEITVVCVQHLVETTGSLIDALIDVGFSPKRIFIKGKIYSTNDVVRLVLDRNTGVNVFPSNAPFKYGHIREFHKYDIRLMWDQVLKVTKEKETIIIIDDGGLAIRYVPNEIIGKYKIYAIEQTTSGLRFQVNRPNIPIIEVATSAAKTLLEPVLIARAIREKIEKLFRYFKPGTIGIVGYGHIGKAISKYFSADFNIIHYDIRQEVFTGELDSVQVVNSLADLIFQADLVVGATGVDISRGVDWEPIVRNDKVLISVSSNDTEFNELIRAQNPTNDQHFAVDVLNDIDVQLRNGYRLKILRGGTVVNFDNSIESCRKEDIQLTRGLLMSGVLQILVQKRRKLARKGPIKLAAHLQRMIVEKWLEVNPPAAKLYSRDLLDGFENESWIDEHSNYPNPIQPV